MVRRTWLFVKVLAGGMGRVGWLVCVGREG